MAEPSPMPSGAHEASLQWVLRDGELHHVSDFAHLKPSDRPEVCCPVCQRPVIMRLGNIRVHHVAHRPEDVCSATEPETILHLNCKFYLQAELRKGRQLLIEQTCRGALVHYQRTSCQVTKMIAWVEGWDDVATECQLGPYRLDVGLLREGQVIGAIEVLVTHEMEPEKIEYLNQQGIRWLEIQAEDSFYEGDDAWYIDKPLRFKRPILERKWQCAECVAAEQEAIRKAKLEAEAERRAEEYRRKNCDKETSMRIVDFYYPDGKKRREVFRTVQLIRNGQVVGICIRRNKGKVVAYQEGAGSPEARLKLKQTFRDYLDHRQAQGALIDEPMTWQQWPPKFDVSTAHNEEIFPRRYQWNGSEWVRDSSLDSVHWDEYWKDRNAYLFALAAIPSKKKQPTPFIAGTYETEDGIWVTEDSTTYVNQSTGALRDGWELFREIRHGKSNPFERKKR